VALLGLILIVAPVLYGAMTVLSPLPPTRTVQTAFTKPTEFDPVLLPLGPGAALDDPADARSGAGQRRTLPRQPIWRGSPGSRAVRRSSSLS
jgi:hypothetical protein